jgi:DNA-binding transcriptional LysR family regulator
MNLTHVLAFHRVAAAGSYTLAARLGGISQPTLSSQVRALERSAGAALFERSGRGVRLTATGERLYAATAKLAGAMDEVRRTLALGPTPARGRLRISADSAVHVLPVLAELKKSVATLHFSLRIDNSAEVIAQVLAEEADVGIMARPTADLRLHTIKIREDRLVLLVSAKDKLARRKQVRFTALAGRDLVVRERGSITREVAEARLASEGVAMGQVFDVATREAVGEAVAAGFGVGVIFASEVGRDPRLKAVAIVGADVSVAEFAICRAERRGLGFVGKFLDTARQLALSNGWLATRPRGAA